VREWLSAAIHHGLSFRGQQCGPRIPLGIKAQQIPRGACPDPIPSGVEGRGAQRRAQEWTRHPLRTIANFLFFLFLGALIYVLSVASLLLHRSFVNF